MIVNLRLILALLLVFVGLTGCHRDDPDDFVPAPRPRVTLTLSLSAPGSISDAGTKAPVPATTAEKKIYNLNIFLFPINHPAAYVDEDKRHYYISESQLIPDPADNTGTKYLPIELKDVCLGEYQVYIIANNSKGNLCESTHGGDPTGCAYKHTDMPTLETNRTRTPQTTGIIMSGTISSLKVLASTVITDPINLSFNMARVNFSYHLENVDAKKIEIFQVFLQNAVLKARPFGDGTWGVGNTEPYDKVVIRENFGIAYTDESFSTTLYLGANPQGGILIPSGGDPNLYRTAKYAPNHATYAYFSCRYLGTVVGYTAYLGDDRPDEANKIYFDIFPNYIYNVKNIFRTPNLDDERLCSFTFEPNRDKLYFGPSGDFVYEGTTEKVVTTNIELQSGVRAIETIFKIGSKNYFNDRFHLTCQAKVITGARFRVYKRVSAAWEEIPPRSTAESIFEVLETGVEATYATEVKVVYEQTGESQAQVLNFYLENRNGQLIKTESPAFNVVRP